jgi:hypothetical protein
VALRFIIEEIVPNETKGRISGGVWRSEFVGHIAVGIEQCTKFIAGAGRKLNQINDLQE